jgi:hypothetical protein
MLVFDLPDGTQMFVALREIAAIRDSSGMATLELDHTITVNGVATSEVATTDAMQDVMNSMISAAFSLMPPPPPSSYYNYMHPPASFQAPMNSTANTTTATQAN